MSRRVVVLAAALLLAACARPAAIPPVDETATGAPDPLPATAPLAAEQEVVADQPLPAAVEAVADAVQTPVVAAVEALEAVTPTVPLPPAPVGNEAACRRAAAALIIRWEVTSESWYNRRLQFPIWPGGSSGVTWGIGYDGGHATRSTILDDWSVHEHRMLLSESAGITGNRAKGQLYRFKKAPTPYPYAAEVFETRSLIEYERRARRAFREGFDDLRPTACGAAISLVYNRGAAMTGDSRREMRVLRDECIPSQDYACMARELRSMCRIWRGAVNENGLCARRNAEALLAETSGI